MANTNENDENVVVGHVYVERDGELEVIPFHFDFGSAVVSFAPVGRASEEKVASRDFLKRFKYLGAVSSRAEDQKPNPEPGSKTDTPTPVAKTLEAQRLEAEAQKPEPAAKVAAKK